MVTSLIAAQVEGPPLPVGAMPPSVLLAIPSPQGPPPLGAKESPLTLILTFLFRGRRICGQKEMQTYY